MTTLAGNILTPQGFIVGEIAFADAGSADSAHSTSGRILAISGTPVSESVARKASVPLILPGFIDLHVHGGGGRDIMEGGDATRRVAQIHACHGTTALLATTVTAPEDDLDAAFAGVAASGCLNGAPTCGARVLGMHLEGPSINPARLGAQPDFVRPMKLEELTRLNTRVPIRVITLAPESAENMGLIEALCAAGYRVQIGHSEGSYEEGIEALAKGAGGFTHLFNAMSGLHHRSPGIVGAALAHARYAEIIPDLLHVHPGAIRVALRAIPGLYCVTDSTAATGMPDGEYRLGRRTVSKCLGGVRLADGTLAGSTLTMIEALRNLVNELHMDLAEASLRVSTYAADYLGETRRGRLVEGAWADLVVLDRDLQLQQVFVEGVAIDLAHAN